MDILFIFFLIATPILGLLCLIVLEYQNSRNRQWMRSGSLPKLGVPSQADMRQEPTPSVKSDRPSASIQVA